MPEVIGVITSESGAVFQDILHRLKERFPRTIILWSVPVQGEDSARTVAEAIVGFNSFEFQKQDKRPDLLIVARGGGSLEDLWGFNEEIVIRAVANSKIPIISAIGHETDTTLIDYVADKRAPTPTAAAEMAVPEIPAKSIEALILTYESPPLICPKRWLQNLIILSVSPPWFIKFPAIIKPGMLSKTNTSIPAYILSGTTTKGVPLKIK